MMRKLILTVFSVGAWCALADGLWSDPTLVVLRTDETPLWRTATNSVMTLEWLYPKGAGSAELTVDGLGYHAEHQDDGAGRLEVSFPEPTDEMTENVYNLTLTFDNGEIRTASLGVVRGVGTGGEFVRTSCRIKGRAAKRIFRRAVLPIPFGAMSLALNGVLTETGLGGAAGWYAWDLSGCNRGDDIRAVLTIGDDTLEADGLILGNDGSVLIFR